MKLKETIKLRAVKAGMFSFLFAFCIACENDLEKELDKVDELNQAELKEDMTMANPTVFIQLSPKKVCVGQPVTITVAASAGWGLETFWWFGANTGISDLDKAHMQNGRGLKNEIASYSWTIFIQTPGTYKFGANSRDTRYQLHCKPGGHPVPHQASEAAGPSFDEVTVTGDCQ